MSAITRNAIQEVIATPLDFDSLIRSKKKLRIKYGIDPTSEDLHLGHAIGLRKLREFQEDGHHILLVIGDFTATIGDPSGKNTTRPALTEKEVKQNMKEYLAQAGKILNLKKTEVFYNSSWLNPLTLKDFISYATLVNVASLTEREDFQKRLNNNDPVSLRELLYPIVQAIDSIHLKVDVELGGWDQRLNLLLARELQKKVGQPPQTVILVKPLVGLDGERKMSKSYGNYVGLNDNPDQMFGKLMSINDKDMVSFAELAAWFDAKQLKDFQAKAKTDPREAKAELAEKILALYYGIAAGKAARATFDRTFRDRQVDDTLLKELTFDEPAITVLQAVSQAAEVSNSQALRLIEQYAVKIDGQPVTEPRNLIALDEGTIQLQIGKHRFFTLRWKK